MDDDLQNPPEEIPKLIQAMKEGYDAVIGAPENKQDTIFKNLGSRIIRTLVTHIFNKPKELKLSSFRIMRKAISDEIKEYKTPYPFIAGIMLSLTKNIGNVTVKHESRRYGGSNYNFSKLLNLSFNLIINYTSLPLKVLAFTGIILSFISFSLGMYFVLKKLFIGVGVPGWTSLVVLTSVFNGILLAVLSLMGEYLVRIIAEVSHHRQFSVREKQL
jgi:hypothetical protein